MENPTLSTRPLEEKDLPFLMDYWYGLSDQQLLAMGVDLEKFSIVSSFESNMRKQLQLPIEGRNNFAMLWEIDGKPAGHNNINVIEKGVKANMHLHLWHPEERQKGIGQQLLKRSIPYFFKHFNLQYLLCEPYAHNPAPNKTLNKLGFTFIKKYTTIPGTINFEQEVNQWKLTAEEMERICTI